MLCNLEQPTHLGATNTGSSPDAFSVSRVSFNASQASQDLQDLQLLIGMHLHWLQPSKRGISRPSAFFRLFPAGAVFLAISFYSHWYAYASWSFVAFLRRRFAISPILPFLFKYSIKHIRGGRLDVGRGYEGPESRDSADTARVAPFPLTMLPCSPCCET